MRTLKSLFQSGSRIFYTYVVDGQFELEWQEFDQISMAHPLVSSYQPDLVIDNIDELDFEVINNVVYINKGSGCSGFIKSFDSNGHRCFYFSQNDVLVVHVQQLEEKPNQNGGDDDDYILPAEQINLIKSNMAEFLSKLEEGLNEFEDAAKKLSFDINNFEDTNKAELSKMPDIKIPDQQDYKLHSDGDENNAAEQLQEID
jgi:hypothetical protein